MRNETSFSFTIGIGGGSREIVVSTETEQIQFKLICIIVTRVTSRNYLLFTGFDTVNY